MTTLDETNACGVAQTMAVGETLTLHLAENPTTGFRWDIAVGEGLTIVSNDFARGASTAPGAGGQRTVVIRAERAGDWPVRAKLWRSWEGDASVTRRCDFSVRAA